MKVCNDNLFHDIFPFLSITDIYKFMQLSKNTYQFTTSFIHSNHIYMKSLFDKQLRNKLEFFRHKISNISYIDNNKHYEWYFYINDLFYHINDSYTLFQSEINPLLSQNKKYVWTRSHTKLFHNVYKEIHNSFKYNYIKFKKKYYINK